MRPTTAPVTPTEASADATPVATPAACWYRDVAHRPRLGSCPRACQGPPSHAERVGNGDQHVYCETHAAWRRRTIRLPTLVFQLAPGPDPR